MCPARGTFFLGLFETLRAIHTSIRCRSSAPAQPIVERVVNELFDISCLQFPNVLQAQFERDRFHCYVVHGGQCRATTSTPVGEELELSQILVLQLNFTRPGAEFK